MEHYFRLSWKHRKKVPPVDINIELIRAALFSFFGVTDKKTTAEEVEKKISKMPVHEVTKAEKDAWIKAGMPNFPQWILQHRKGR